MNRSWDAGVGCQRISKSGRITTKKGPRNGKHGSNSRIERYVSLSPASSARQTVLSNQGSLFMLFKRWVIVGVMSVMAVWGSVVEAGDLKITIPRRSRLTPVQRLNHEGVEAIHKRNYEKAESLFYKAYLFDPDDPFTLNNLAYISELKGQVDRAQRYYALAGQQTTDAVIDVASSQRVEGRQSRHL